MPKRPARRSSPFPSSPSPGAASLDRELSDAVVFFHAAIASHLGMSVADWKCLGLLERHGSMTAGRLAHLSGFTTGAVTGIVDRLERAGYARRAANPADRRSVIVQPGNLGRLQQRIRPVFASLLRGMDEIAHQYTAAQRKTIQRWVTQTVELLREETRKLKQP